MSEQDNVQRVRDAYAAFSRGDIQTVLDTLTDDVQWSIPGPSEVPFAGDRSGKAEVAAFFQELAQAEDITAFEPKTVMAQGDLVVALGRYAATVKATGKSVDMDWVHVFTFRGGRCAVFDEYYDTAKYAEAFRSPVTA